MPNVFISHTHADYNFASKLAYDLSDRGLAVKFAHQLLSPGEYWAEVVEEEIRRAENFLIVLSQNSVNSDWMRAEAAVAIAQGEKRIVPVYAINNVEVPFMLREFRGVDLSDPEGYGNSLDELATLLLEQKSPRVPMYSNLALAMQYSGRERDAWTTIEKIYLNDASKLKTRFFAVSCAFIAGFSAICAGLLLVAYFDNDFRTPLAAVIGAVAGVAGSTATFLFSRAKRDTEADK